MRFAVADDVLLARKAVEKLILEWDRDSTVCCSCDNGDEVLKVLEDQKVDVLVTDIRMPVLSGLELIKKVIDEGRSVHFIVISGYKYFEYAQQAIKYGVEDYLLKPIDEVELNQILKKIADTEANREKESRSVDTMVKKLHDSRYICHLYTSDAADE